MILEVYNTLDIIAQAKAGTGKTCVFGVVALEAIQPGVEGPQVSSLQSSFTFSFGSQI